MPPVRLTASSPYGRRSLSVGDVEGRGGVGGEEEVGEGEGGGVAATCRVFQTFDTLPEQVDFIGLLRAQQEFLLPLVSDFKSNGVVQSAYS